MRQLTTKKIAGGVKSWGDLRLVRQQLPLLLEKSAQSVSQCTMQGVLLLLEEGVNAGAQCWCWNISLL
jgi:hypothetical protein